MKSSRSSSSAAKTKTCITHFLSWIASALLLSFMLSSCGVYEMATAHSSDEASMDCVCMLMAPPLLVTGMKAMDDRPEESELPYYARVVRNRNLGKPTDDSVRITYMAAQDAFQLPSVQQMSESQVIALFGPPDRREKSQWGIVFYYCINTPKSGHEEVRLLLDRRTPSLTKK